MGPGSLSAYITMEKYWILFRRHPHRIQDAEGVGGGGRSCVADHNESVQYTLACDPISVTEVHTAIKLG